MTLYEIIDLCARFGLALIAIGMVYRIELEALRRGINGRVMATTIGLLAGIAAALLGIRLQDFLGR